MGWIILLAFVAIALGLILRFAKLPRSGVELLIAAMLVGIAGYVWQGRPDEAGHPVVSAEAAAEVDAAAVETRRAISGRFGADQQWLDLSDALLRIGSTRSAVTAIRSGLKKNPDSVDLWVGLGNALVAHGQGVVSPAAVYAFQHAAMLSPMHPGPPFFYGLALAQSGDTGKAADIWRALLARTPPDAPWRADLEARLASIGDVPQNP